MTDDQQAIEQKKQILELLTVSNEFCMFIEKSYDYSKAEIFQYMHRMAPLLYLKGSLLPELEIENPDAYERYVTEEVWESIFNELRNTFGKDDLFWFINEPGFNGDEITKGSMAEHLTDIYQDLKDFVFLYSKNTHDSILNAVFECRKLYHTNWGYKIIRLQKNIHHLLYQDQIESEYPEL
ncbi:MAG: DUF5063 domain-containing protein [Bacteroidota bacterium]